MKPNDNIKLADVLAKVTVEVLSEDEIEVARKIKGIVRDLESGNVEVEKAKSALKKAEISRDKIATRIEKIKTGDWSALAGEEK